MVIEMVFFNEIQVFQFSLHFLKYIYSCVHYWKKIKIKLQILSFGQNINNISNIKNDVLCNVLNQVR
jgi:hypothetical protein